MPTPPASPPPPAAEYDRNAIFSLDGPIDPLFMDESVRTLLRTMPLETEEPDSWISRRMFTALSALAALHPRDEIEVMLGVQAVAAYQAASTGWYLAMNHHLPRGDSTRHLNAAASAARTFDTMIKAIERRQAKPLSIPIGRPPCQSWEEADPVGQLDAWCNRLCPEEPYDQPSPVTWTPEALRTARDMRDAEEFAADYGDLDLTNTQGIEPDGGIVVSEQPTTQQEAYMARRYALNLRDQHRANLKAGLKQRPKIIPFRTGDRIP
ncbi:MAG: hypothetical protein U1E70_04015 [Acetobacteraceae bacterium]|nr:hypothetical protein [Pseudomonadota bacterium]